MAINTDVAGSPGWWMQRLWIQLQAKQKRQERLWNYFIGKPPLPLLITENQRSVFYRFQQTARTNFASLIIKSRTQRIGVRAIKTGADADAGGDQKAWDLWNANDLSIYQGRANRHAFIFGEAYYICGSPVVDGGPAVITAEDPRQVITACDPLRPNVAVAALKVFHDDTRDLDLAYLWLPGVMYVASRKRKSRLKEGQFSQPKFAPAAFDMAPFALGNAPLDPANGTAAYPEVDPEQDPTGLRSERYEVQEVPVYRVINPTGSDDCPVGEFELHTDLLDRINHMLLQRITIATFQAFRQRALKLTEDTELPETDDAGQPINYDELFAADPGALWKLPAGVEIWESGVVDLTPILSSVKDDVLHLAAVTQVPLSMFTPDAATQTAEGAALQREGSVYSVEEYETYADRALARAIAVGFNFMGDDSRSDAAKVSIDWTPPDRYSLAEQGSADAQAISLPFKEKLRIIWQMTPAEIEVAVTNRADDLVYAQQLAAVQAAQAPAQEHATAAQQQAQAETQATVRAQQQAQAEQDAQTAGRAAAARESAA